MAIKCPRCDSENTDTARFCSSCATPLPNIEDVVLTKTLEIPIDEFTRGTLFAGRYEIIEELGKGGMGKVYRAEDMKIHEEVALKLIKPEISSDKKTIERFRNELKLARKIRHKNVCAMFYLGEEKDTHFITMEYISGQDLKGLIRQTGQLTVGKAISITKQVCEGLSEAHSLGIVHRDLKPNNIMIDENGNARIMDFGIARSAKEKGITSPGVMIGTPEYMSPEQVEAKEVDQRSDIYSLGIIIYEMLTGRLPFEADTPFAVGVKHKSEIPKEPKDYNPQISDDMNQLILKCLEKNKEDRYQSAEQLRSNLLNIEKGITTTEKVRPQRKPLTSREITVTLGIKKLFMPAIVVIILIIAVVIMKSLLQKDKVPIQAKELSIAVLPFDDFSPQGDQEYFCNGMTDEIIADLSHVRGISRVTAMTSVTKFKDSKADSKTIGQELNVQYLLEGNVRKSGNNIRIRARLIDAANDAQLWVEEYTGTLENIFTIQDQVARSIVDALQLELGSEEMEKIAEITIKDVRAYEYYMRAKQEILQRTEESLDRALKFLQDGLDILGENATIYTGMGNVYLIFVDYGIRGGDVYLQKAEEYAKKALSLESNSALALDLLGSIERQKGNITEFLRYKKHAFSIDPNVPANLRSLIYYYSFMAGKSSVANLLVKRLLEIDPVPPRNQYIAMQVHWMEGRFDIALELQHKVYLMEPDNPVGLWYYAQLLAWNNQYEDAYEYIDKLAQDLPQHVLSWSNLFFKYSLQGDKDKALKLITEERKSFARKDYHMAWLFAECYALLDEKQEALDWLEVAISKGWANYPLFSQLDPFLANIRGETRFKKLMEKVKFDWENVEDLEWPTK